MSTVASAGYAVLVQPWVWLPLVMLGLIVLALAIRGNLPEVLRRVAAALAGLTILTVAAAAPMDLIRSADQALVDAQQRIDTEVLSRLPADVLPQIQHCQFDQTALYKPHFDENGLLKVAGTACTTKYTPDPKDPVNADYLRRWLYPEVLVRNTIQRYWQQGMIGSQNLTGPDADLGARFLNGQAVNLKLPDLTKIQQNAPAGAVWCTYQDNQQVCGRVRQTRPARQRRRRHRSRVPLRHPGRRGHDLPLHPGPRREPHRRRVQRARRVRGRRPVPGRRLHRRPDRPAAAPARVDRRPVRRDRHDGPPAPGPPGPERDRRQPARGAAVQRGRRAHDLPVHGHAQPHHGRRDPARPDRRGDHPRPGVAAGVVADPPDQTHHRHVVLRRHRQPAPAVRAAAPGDGRPGRLTPLPRWRRGRSHRVPDPQENQTDPVTPTEPARPSRPEQATTARRRNTTPAGPQASPDAKSAPAPAPVEPATTPIPRIKPAIAVASTPAGRPAVQQPNRRGSSRSSLPRTGTETRSRPSPGTDGAAGRGPPPPAGLERPRLGARRRRPRLPTRRPDHRPVVPAPDEPAVFRPPDPPPWADHGRPETRTTRWPSTVDDPRRTR